MLNARENSHCNKYYFVEAFSEKWDDSFIDIKVDLNDISRYIGMLEFRFMLCKVNIYLKKVLMSRAFGIPYMLFWMSS